MSKEIEKKYGKGLILDAKSILEEEVKIIPMSPLLDLATGGGIQEGSLVIMSGKTGCGKSYSALSLAAHAQRPEFGNRKVLYDDVEGRLKKMNLTGTHGLNLDNFEVIRSTKDKILSAEEHLGIVEHHVKTTPELIAIVDSASVLCSSTESVNDISGQTRSIGPKLLAAFCRRLANVIPIQKTILIIIQHLIANTSGYGQAYFEDGGNKIQHQANYKFRCTSFPTWESKDGKPIGQIPTWQVIKSALGPPCKSVQSYLKYGHGIDETMEWIQLGLQFGFIGKAGAWYALEFLEGEQKKIQGEEKLYYHFLENTDHLNLLISKIKEII